MLATASSTGEDTAIAAVLVDRVHNEWLALAAAVYVFVAPLPRDSRHRCAVEDAVTQHIDEWGEVLTHPLRPRRVAVCRRRPGRLEQATRCSVGELRPA
ncbi:hypothetical protein CJ226_07180 [Microbacterium sp. UMB0228]|nr:hypothetical protein CJ226_07180 [Microbacterium sp. UMB0228]